MTSEQERPDDEGVPVRHEKATLRLVYAYGGTLTLTGTTLIWKRSRWPSLYTGSVGSRPTPKLLKIDVRESNTYLGPRKPVPWGLFILFPWTILHELLSGGFRRTIEVATPDGYYFFSVKDAESWLRDIAIVREEAPDD